MKAFSSCLLVGVLALAGCGSDSSGGDSGPPDAPPLPDSGPDAEPPDASPPDAPPPTGIGELCPNGNECNPGLLCLDENVDPDLPPDGYCTDMCLTDADCGWDSFCSPPLGGGIRLCFQRCLTDETGCAGAPERVCGDLLGGVVATTQRGCFPGDPTAHDGDACGSFAECNADSACIMNDFELPGGYCVTVGCTVGDNSTCAPGGDGVCVPSDGNTICVDSCGMTSDCRTGDGYVCTMPPGAPVSICLLPHLDTGDPCTASAECGDPASAWECLTGPSFPGGYCSGAIGACDMGNPDSCPNDGVCYDPTPVDPGNADQFCAARCDPTVVPSACREGEGYACAMIGPTMGACAVP